jgi:hypothetical protein
MLHRSFTRRNRIWAGVFLAMMIPQIGCFHTASLPDICTVHILYTGNVLATVDVCRT